MVDMHTIGAGGGSIARIDPGGALQVGPESSGADPGPACYGRGGAEATVTDANLVLGRLQAKAFLGGAMELDAAAAARALGPLASALGCSAEEAALGIVRVANEHMAQALRVISVRRGIDPRGFTLMSFGGAGGLHVCALAQALGMSQAIVPVHAGVLSALGMLATRPGRQLSRTWPGVLQRLAPEAIERQFAELEAHGRASLLEEGVPAKQLTAEYSLDLRYRGQSYTLNVPWRDVTQAIGAFAARHEARYGHRMEVAVELVNLRVVIAGAAVYPQLSQTGSGGPAQPAAETSLFGLAQPVPVYPRANLAQGQRFWGPALVTETVATTWLEAGWECRVDRFGNLLLSYGKHPDGSAGR